MKVYIIRGDNDEVYSDAMDWNLGVTSTQELADEFIERYKAAVQEAKELYNEWQGVRPARDEWEAAYQKYRNDYATLEREYGFEIQESVVNYHVEEFELDSFA